MSASRTTRSAAALGLTVVVLAGCVGDRAGTGGPLSLGETTSELCIPSPTGEATMGHRRLVHDGDESVTVTEVTLEDAEGLHLIEAVLVPAVDGVVHTGVQSSYPPREDLPPGWPDRVPAVGAVVEPGEEWGLTVGLRTTSRRGRAESVRVRYEDADGGRFETTYLTSVTVRQRCL